MDESLIPLTPEETAEWGVRTRGKAASVPAIAALETSHLDEAMAEPDREREETFRHLKEFHKQQRLTKRLERQAKAAEER